jgi:hypothetical protein
MEKIKTFLERWGLLLGLALLIPCFLWAAQTLLAFTNVPNSNFFKIWLAGNLAWTGNDAYSPAAWFNGHQFAGSTWMPEKTFLYPLPLAYALAPLGALPLREGYVIWAFLSLLACAASIFLLVNQWPESKLKLFALPALLAVLLFAPTLETAGKGTLGAVLLLGIAGALELFKRKQPMLGGIFLSFLLLKPQLGAPILAVMGLWLVFRRDWRGIAGIFLGGLLLLAVGMAGDAQWVGKFVHISQQKLGLTFGAQPTLFSLASLVCTKDQSCAVGLGGILSLVLIWRLSHFFFRQSEKLSALVAISIAIPAGMLMTPYLWSYDHVLLVVPFIWLAYQIIRRTEKYIFAMLFLVVMDTAAGIGLYLQGLRPEKDFWSILVPFLTLLLVVGFALRGDALDEPGPAPLKPANP